MTPAIIDQVDQQPDESRAQELVQQLIAEDPDAASWLLRWLEEAKTLAAPAPVVQNTIAGNAHIQAGGVYQAHTVNIQQER